MKTAVYLSSRPEWRYIIEEINDGHSSREWGAESEQKERREKREEKRQKGGESDLEADLSLTIR